MIDLTKKFLPNTIAVGGRNFAIYTDFRAWMRFVTEFERWDKKGELDISYLFKNDIPCFECMEDFDSIFDFAFPKNIIPKSEGNSGAIVLDFKIDSDYIYSAFLQQYGIDLLDVRDLHWHKFKALLNGISKHTMLFEIMGYRAYSGNDKEMNKIRSYWEIPIEESDEEKQQEIEFENFFDCE